MSFLSVMTRPVLGLLLLDLCSHKFLFFDCSCLTPRFGGQRFACDLASPMDLRIVDLQFFSFFSFLKDLFIFRERRKEGEREGEKHQCVVASCMPPTRDLVCNPGMCPDWESNRRLFGSQASTQSNELHQPGLFFDFLMTAILTGVIVSHCGFYLHFSDD